MSRPRIFPIGKSIAINIMMDHELYDLLAKTARAQQKSMAEVARGAIARHCHGYEQFAKMLVSKAEAENKRRG